MLWTALICLLMFVVSLAAICVVIVLVPAPHFVDEPQPFWANKPPLVRWIGLFGKNLSGLALIMVGIVLSVPGIPGQGLLTILIGLMLLDIPGKHRLARTLVRRPRILRTMNRIRSLFGRPPLMVESR